MSTYLELCQKLRRECRIAGTGPSAVTGQTGLLERVVGWIPDAYRDIQLRCPSWRWMRTEFTVNTVDGTDAYAYGACTDVKTGQAITRFRAWWAHDRRAPFKCHRTSDGVATQGYLIYLPYSTFRHTYKFGAQQSQTGQPAHISVDDSNRIVIGPNPNGVYTISGEFQRGAQILADDDDEPDMPEDYHDLIVYYAMQRYAASSIAAEVLARANLEGGRLLRALERDQMPAMILGGALA